MIENLNWNNIRPINGSQKEGFEELVCQLARNEKINNSKLFTRKGSPDAGVECFWSIEDNTEIAWQAKFFTSPLTNTQWGEIDKSVKTMLNKHPKTKKYIVSIPQDRADARVDGQKSFLQKWNDRVEKWEKWAKEKGLKIEFIYEGSSELLSKLALPINSGKTFFWFNKDELRNEWFQKHNSGKIKDLGARYTPEINVDLDIKYVFEGLFYTPELQAKLKSNIDDVDRKFKYYIRYLGTSGLNNLLKENSKVYSQFSNAIQEINLAFLKSFKSSKELFKLLLEQIEAIQHSFLYEGNNKLKNDKIDELQKEYIKFYHSVDICLNSFIGFDGDLLEKPKLLIEGKGGIGKSHLIADVILEKQKQNQLSILLLGQHFNNGDIWAQILSDLDVKLTKNEFLGALNSKAESTKSRIIIFIDAINEGEGKYLWKDRLLSFIHEFDSFENLGIVFSIRDTYNDIVLPDNLNDSLERLTLTGFDNDSEAIKMFFDYYEINEPPVPLLNPEFSNPLFLKLFCKGLYDNGLKNIPSGYEGISTVFEYVIKAANKSISKRLDYDCKMFDLVSESVKILIEKIIESPSLRIFKNEAYSLLTNELKNHVENSRKILTELINENIVNENALYNPKTEKYDREIIYFSYEKFGDHLIINSIIENEKQELLDSKIIKPEMKLYNFVKDEYSIIKNRGLIEAMSIQLPEKIGYELYELLENNKLYDIGQYFLYSLVWRKNSSIKDKVLDYINNYIVKVRGLNKQFKNLLVQLCMKKEHYFNARFLDGQLEKMSLTDRDAFWTLFINQDEYQVQHMPSILISWARESKMFNRLDLESKKLLSLTLTWFLTSSNRTIRDNSTKALVKLFENDLTLLEQLIEQFKDINDIYVLERLYAVAYGASLRTESNEELKKFSKYIYDSVFNNKVPNEHLLLRDYARGVIEFANYRGLTSGIKLDDIRPPYGSKMPSKLPSQKDIEKYDITKDKKNTSQNQLYDYVMGFSDFARYTIGTNGSSKISLITIESLIAYNKLSKSLKKKENEALDTIFQTIKDYNDEKISDDYKKMLKVVVDKGEKFLENVFNISKDEAEQVYNYMLSYVKSSNYFDKSGKFDLADFQRLIIKDVFESSKWKLKKFQDYDHGKFDYFNKKPFSRIEAIGKKYIWIAYYKWLAIIFDNFLINNDYASTSKWGIYDGSWSPFERDIDPTLMNKAAIKENEYNRSEPTFWSPKVEISFKKPNNGQWVFDKEDIVNPKKLIEVSDKDNTWLNLSSMPSWKAISDDENTRREVWYHIKSCIVKKKDKKSILKALQDKSFWNHNIPQEREVYEVFSREYYWSEAYKHRTYDEETRILHSSFTDDKFSGIMTSIQYTWYSDRDFSLNEHVYITRPNKGLYDLLELRFKENEHCFFNEKDELVLHNPAIKLQKGVDSLLVRKDVLLSKLEEQELDIIWFVLGAKEVIASNKIINESHINNVFYFNEEKLLAGDFKLEEARFD
ncbi:conserved hypothetical protein [Tenacibaculum litopenaei]|uniref:AVAST type 2 anti-phage system protein Avs2 n=1 Tax=Tenacibaculum litopenaei TaxID=396016 RepID=UPI003893E51E